MNYLMLAEGSRAAVEQKSAAVDQPLFWALMVAWIASVVLHEFAHGLVAHLGGDYTVKERGGLTLNPLKFIDPITTIIIPTAFLLAGGIPFPGGSTRIRLDLIRSRSWQTAMSLAGPGTNILLFFLLAIPLHPAWGWAADDALLWTKPQLLMGAMAFLQLFVAILNLIPIPSFDGFGALRPWLPREVVKATDQGRMISMMVLFVVLYQYGDEFFNYVLMPVLKGALMLMHFGPEGAINFHNALIIALYNPPIT